MAIVIPSKRIYDISNNDKINKNRISYVEWDETQENTLTDTNNLVYTDEKTNIQANPIAMNNFPLSTINYAKQSQGQYPQFVYNYPAFNWKIYRAFNTSAMYPLIRIVMFGGDNYNTYDDKTILINKKQENNKKVVKNVYYGKNTEGENQIKCVITYTERKYINSAISGRYYIDTTTPTPVYRLYRISNITYGAQYTDGTYVETNEQVFTYSHYYEQISDAYGTVQAEEIEIGQSKNSDIHSGGYSNIDNVVITDEIEGIKQPYFTNIDDIYIQCKRRVFYTYNERPSVPDILITEGKEYEYNEYTFQRYGEIIEYIPQKIELSFYGNVTVYEFEEETQSSGSIEKNLYKLENNELLINETKINNTKIGQYIASKIIDEYSDGKEVAEIRCSINDYYDTEGNKVIDISNNDKMTFSVGDIVIPYRNVPNVSQEPPISYYKNGQPKQFLVTGVGIEFDGALWQKLQLQEVKSNT